MKILFISDIHGEYANLDVIDKFDFNKLIFLGDLYNHGNEITDNTFNDFCNKYRDKLICVKGNCDSDNDYKKLNIPLVGDYFTIKDGNINIVCTHGHLYNYHKLSHFDSSSVLIYGHEHIPYIEVENDIVYICVGSISKPRYGSKAGFCIYENHKFTLYSITGEIIDVISI